MLVNIEESDKKKVEAERRKSEPDLKLQETDLRRREVEFFKFVKMITSINSILLKQKKLKESKTSISKEQEGKPKTKLTTRKKPMKIIFHTKKT